jgi:hypothetical protein
LAGVLDVFTSVKRASARVLLSPPTIYNNSAGLQFMVTEAIDLAKTRRALVAQVILVI